MRLYCKHCESEIITPRMELPVCPICLNATILLHQPTLVDLNRLEDEAKHLHLTKLPDWETPEQWEKRTGKAWPDNWGVYINAWFSNNGKSIYIDSKWQTTYLKEARRIENILRASKQDFSVVIVIATEAGPPPNDWRTEGE